MMTCSAGTTHAGENLPTRATAFDSRDICLHGLWHAGYVNIVTAVLASCPCARVGLEAAPAIPAEARN